MSKSIFSAPQFLSEEAAYAYAESKIWPNGKPVCPHCGSKERINKMNGKATELASISAMLAGNSLPSKSGLFLKIVMSLCACGSKPYTCFLPLRRVLVPISFIEPLGDSQDRLVHGTPYP